MAGRGNKVGSAKGNKQWAPKERRHKKTEKDAIGYGSPCSKINESGRPVSVEGKPGRESIIGRYVWIGPGIPKGGFPRTEMLRDRTRDETCHLEQDNEKSEWVWGPLISDWAKAREGQPPDHHHLLACLAKTKMFPAQKKMYLGTVPSRKFGH